MRLHLCGLPHTETTDAYSWCAFTALAKTFSTMMTRQGYEVILYAGVENEAECFEHVVCHGPVDDKPIVPEFTPEAFAPMNERVIEAMRERIEPGDLVLLTSGWAQQALIGAFGDNLCVEPMVGYYGTAAKHRVFPSYAWMHVVYAGQHAGTPQAIPGQMYDAVIPHFLDPGDFPQGPGGDYLLFCGRLNWDKGLGVAVDVAKRTGLELKIAGAGTPPEYGEYLGVVGPKERAELMGQAVAVLAPSLYCEPFCLVAVEAQMCGTPAITTDFGAFSETVEASWRCRTMAEFCDAVEAAQDAGRAHIRRRALETYSTAAVAPQYHTYFKRLGSLFDGGWYS